MSRARIPELFKDLRTSRKQISALLNESPPNAMSLRTEIAKCNVTLNHIFKWLNKKDDSELYALMKSVSAREVKTEIKEDNWKYYENIVAIEQHIANSIKDYKWRSPDGRD